MNARALRRMASEVDEQHREGMRDLVDDLHRAHLDTSDPALTTSRRRFLSRLAAGGAVVSIGGISVPVLSPGVAAAAEDAEFHPDETDVELARFAWSLELTAVAAYSAAIETRLLDPQLEEVAGQFRRHHQDHADAFATLLGTIKVEPNGGTTTTTTPAEPNAALLDVLGPQVTGASTAAQVLQVARDLEEGAAATYLLALENLSDETLASAAATILPVESQHAVVLSQALEDRPADYLPTFQTTAAALDPAEYGDTGAPANPGGADDEEES